MGPVDPQWVVGETLGVLRGMPGGSVDLIVTSPPYYGLRSYTDGGEHYDGQIGSEATPQDFLAALWAVTAECRRVLKPSGSLWANLGDKMNEKCLMGLPWRYAIGCIDDLDLILRAEVIWSKPNGLPESVTDRVRRSHEQWFHFTKEPRYFTAVDEVREPQQSGDTRPPADGGKWGNEGRPGNHQLGRLNQHSNPLGKLPGSVWTIPSEPLKVPDWLGVDHFAAYPQEWPRRIILGWSPSGICVECGDGRRPVVAKEFVKKQESNRVRPTFGGELSHGKGSSAAGYPVGREAATITGYACACPAPDAPTRPAVVLDPFAGTGTTLRVASRYGRLGLGIDGSADYARLAAWRCGAVWSETANHGRVWIRQSGGAWVAEDRDGEKIRACPDPNRLKRMLGEYETGETVLDVRDAFDLPT